jgi:RES domain
VSSPTWTPRAVASSAKALSLDLWRAVEAQHEAATMPLVDSLDEQLVLERLIDAVKPPLPREAQRLHYLLFTPFRYAPPPGGSRFRASDDPGVFYGADAVRTACAELGYWRWRHLLDTPALAAMPQKAQTVFKVKVATHGVDLRVRPFDRDATSWTDPLHYGACQRFAKVAREAQVGIIRYQSVRDPQHAGCGAVLTPAAFARHSPVEQQTWMLSVFRERVVWQRTHIAGTQTFEFRAGEWVAPRSWARARKPAARMRR